MISLLPFTCRTLLTLGSVSLLAGSFSLFLFWARSSFLACLFLCFSSSICKTEKKKTDHILSAINKAAPTQVNLKHCTDCTVSQKHLKAEMILAHIYTHNASKIIFILYHFWGLD